MEIRGEKRKTRMMTDGQYQFTSTKERCCISALCCVDNNSWLEITCTRDYLS